MEFKAKVKILHHPTTIKQNYETMIHCGTIKQVAKIISIEKELLRTGTSQMLFLDLKENQNSFKRINRLFLEKEKQKE